jgi:hypothetical protein
MRNFVTAWRLNYCFTVRRYHKTAKGISNPHVEKKEWTFNT